MHTSSSNECNNPHLKGQRCDCSWGVSIESKSVCVDTRHTTQSTYKDNKQKDSLTRGKWHYHKCYMRKQKLQARDISINQSINECVWEGKLLMI